MSQLSHQIVQLSDGSHRSPDDGGCVMELASMLAGEPFTDRPASVCPVIAAFLRTYNDGRRPPAPRPLPLRLRGRRHARIPHAGGAPRRAVPPVDYRLLPAGGGRTGASRFEPLARVGTKDHQQAGMVAGRLAAQNVRRDRAGAYEATLALVERLIACAARRHDPAPQPPGAPLPTAAPKRSSPTAPLMPRVP
jgi:hypothetical protein